VIIDVEQDLSYAQLIRQGSIIAYNRTEDAIIANHAAISR